MTRIPDVQNAQVVEVLEHLFEGVRPNIVVSHLVDVADPHALGNLLIGRGEDLLDEGDDDEFANKVISVGQSLKRIL